MTTSVTVTQLLPSASLSSPVTVEVPETLARVSLVQAEDVPALFEALRARHPQVRFTLHPAAGESPAVVSALAAAAAALVPPSTPTTPR